MIPDFAYKGTNITHCISVSSKKTIIRTDLPENIYCSVSPPCLETIIRRDPLLSAGSRNSVRSDQNSQAA
jgi:hypothetical protein